MKTILVVTASARYEGAYSRAMSRLFIEKTKALFPEAVIIERDLTAEPLPAVSEEMLSGFFAKTDALPERVKASLSLSNRLSQELLAADLVVIATPMYNFNVPASLKAWIDLVVRPGVTFEKVADGNLRGLCRGKSAMVLCSMGGCFAEHHTNLVEPYLKIIADFIGLENMQFAYMEGTAQASFDEEASLCRVEQDIERFLQDS